MDTLLRCEPDHRRGVYVYTVEDAAPDQHRAKQSRSFPVLRFNVWHPSLGASTVDAIRLVRAADGH